MKIWEQCQGDLYIQNIQAQPWRIVEAQHILSSRDLVDTCQEHDILEEMLESSKPSIQVKKHYLIFTPFRYPPLKYGSRFGCAHEPSLWYGSLERDTAFAEVAYYRLKFFKDTEGDLGYIEIHLTAFTAFVSSEIGIDLTKPPFFDYTAEISHPSSYESSQALGACMRKANIETFIFFSARAKKGGKNLAAYTPHIFYSKKGGYIKNQQTWSCIANKDQIEFIRLDISKKERLLFPVD